MSSVNLSCFFFFFSCWIYEVPLVHVWPYSVWLGMSGNCNWFISLFHFSCRWCLWCSCSVTHSTGHWRASRSWWRRNGCRLGTSSASAVTWPPAARAVALHPSSCSSSTVCTRQVPRLCLWANGKLWNDHYWMMVLLSSISSALPDCPWAISLSSMHSLTFQSHDISVAITIFGSWISGFAAQR